ncbi:hypothetical protein DFH29DRAFT_913632 [Suillus ampliporus]|nr:hypothetical protein DFH29DRAFT_913632 [Suillus ampliporus]
MNSSASTKRTWVCLGYSLSRFSSTLSSPAWELCQCSDLKGQHGRRMYDPTVPLQLTGNKTPIFVYPSVGEVLIFVIPAKYFRRSFSSGSARLSLHKRMMFTYTAAEPNPPVLISSLVTVMAVSLLSGLLSALMM